MRVSAIAAIGENRELGAKNKLLWHIPGELKRFKEITTGHPIIMGRKTYESIGRILPDRTNIIITRDKNFKVDRAIVVHSLDEAIVIAKKVVIPTEERVEGSYSTDLKKNSKSEAKIESNEKDSLTPIVARNDNRKENEIFIIGGGQIFKEAMPITNRLYLTIVHASFPEADVFFPDYGQFTKVIEKEDHESEEFKYTFLTVGK